MNDVPRLTSCAQILNVLVAVVHCFSFGQLQTVLSRVAQALWGVVLHCTLQLPLLSTSSFLQLELEVSVLGKFLASVDCDFTYAAVLHPLNSRLMHSFLPPRRVQVRHQVASAGGFACTMRGPRIQRTGKLKPACHLVLQLLLRRCQITSLTVSPPVRSFHPKKPLFATFCIAARALWNVLLLSYKYSNLRMHVRMFIFCKNSWYFKS
jgi:hypothetical protein